MITVQLAAGGTAQFALADISSVRGGTIKIGSGALPTTKITLKDGTSYDAHYVELGNITNALQAAGLL